MPDQSRQELEQAVERKRLEEAVIAKRSGEMSSAPKEPETAIGESAIRGAAQGATMGFADELTGAALAAKEYAQGKGSFQDLYIKNREESRAAYAKAEKDNPLTYRAGDIAGTIGSVLVPGVAVLAPVKEASIGANALRAAAGGAISGAGYSDAKNLGDLAADTAVGGVLGGVVGAAVDKGGKLIEALKPSNLEKVANQRAVKAAIGQNQKLFEELSAVKAPDTGEIALESAGRRLRESGILKPLSKSEGIAAEVTAAKQAAGENIGLTLKTLDDAVPNAISGKKIADEIRGVAAKLPESELSQSTINRLNNEAQRLEAKGALSFDDAQQLKNIWKFDPRNPEKASIGKQAMNDVNRIIAKNMDETAGHIAETAGTDSPLGILVDSYKKNRGDYQAFKALETGIKKNVPRNLSNRFASPSDYVTGALGLGYGLTQGENGPSLGTAAPYALMGAALNKQIRLRGNSLAASAAGNLANILEKSPEILGRFSETLLKASQISPNALWITHQFLLKNPEYRQTIGVERGQ